MKKRKMKLFSAWQDHKEEEWLTTMAQEGWAFSEYKFGLYTFEKIESTDYVYKLDYKASSDQDLEEYIAIFEDAGWTHVERFHGWHYFRKIRSSSEEDPYIYSDQQSESQKYKGLVTFLIPLFLLTVAIFLTILLPNTRNSLFMDVIKWVYIVLICVYIYAIVRLRFKIKRLNG